MYFVLDIETTTGTSFKRTANPFDTSNWVVAIGTRLQGEDIELDYYRTSKEFHKIDIPSKVTLLVGFNIKFDLLYKWESYKDFIKRGGTIWDCQLAEFLIKGQVKSSHMCSMDKIVESYGGELKVDAVKALWKAGIDTPDINKDILLDYLEGDIRNTEKIFLGQVQKAYDLGMLRTIQGRMDSVLCTTEMEYNGLVIDNEVAQLQLDKLTSDITKYSEELNSFIPKDIPQELKFNWGSSTHKSCLIFKGTVGYYKWVQHKDPSGNLMFANKKETVVKLNGELHKKSDGSYLTLDEVDNLEPDTKAIVVSKLDTYAAGKRMSALKTKVVNVPDLNKPKGKAQEFRYDFKGYTKPRPEWETESQDSRGNKLYSVSATVIEELGYRDIPFLKTLSKFTKLEKDRSTYYRSPQGSKKTSTGMLTLIQDDGKLHHKLNHTSTVTTRLSSADPNATNIPRRDTSDIKKVFVSRFGNEGYMAENDYSQLEVIVQAWLAKEDNMKQMIRDGVDFHCKRLAVIMNEPYIEVYRKCKDHEHPDHKQYDLRRNGTKQISFKRAYGAGIASIVRTTDMSQEDVEEFISNENKMFPKIAVLNVLVENEVKRTRVPVYLYGKVRGVGKWQSPTGVIYLFEENDNGYFSHPSMCNYPIQGTAAEFVQLVLGKLFRHFCSKNNYKNKAFLVNTVHDCVWLDIHKSILEEVLEDTKEIMENLPSIVNEYFNWKPTDEYYIDVPFKVNVEFGPNMYDLSGY